MMRKSNKTVFRFAVVAAVLSLAVFEASASDEKDKLKSTYRPITDVAASLGELSEQSFRYPLDMLGITEMECNCSVTLGEDERFWRFESEPKIKGVDRDGPAHGKLKEGDVIVAIDGMLITTRKAGIRFANLVPDEPVELTVRRWFRTRTVTVVPRAIPEPDVPTDVTVRRDDRSNTLTIEPGVPYPEMARSIEELSRRAVEIGEAITDIGIPGPPDFPTIPELNIDFGEMFPRGWIGFGLSFKGSIKHKDEDKPAQWRFKEAPTIKSVQPGSPADEAGLQVDDVLLEIDGSKLDSRRGSDRFSEMEPGQVIEWKVRRGANEFKVKTTAGERPPRERAETRPVLPFVSDIEFPIRYTGALGDTEIEVRGGIGVRVEVDEETGEIVIRSGDSVVRLRSKEKR